MEQTIAYRFGPDDYIALLRAGRSIGPLGRLGRWGRAGLIGGLAVAFSNDSLSAAPWLALVVGAIVFALVTLVAPIGEYLGEQLMARWLFPRYSFANKDVTLHVGEQDVRSKVGGIEGRISWRSIQRVIETREGLFLALSRAELLQVPRRALPSADAFADLACRVRTKVAAAGAGQ
ncbi:MAG TPA: YcxB family protein [Xanthobacteraceae bacterium]|nr:YcxB family protein [Xanthobacteraceae bacterium]